MQYMTHDQLSYQLHYIVLTTNEDLFIFVETLRHLDNNDSPLLFREGFPVGLKYITVVLDELDHDLVTDILVLHCFKAWSHTEKEGAQTNRCK